MKSKMAVLRRCIFEDQRCNNDDRFDSELTIGSVIGIKKSRPLYLPVMDTIPVKRVELHCHTKMSDEGGFPMSKTHQRAMTNGDTRPSPSQTTEMYSVPGCNHAMGKDDDFKIISGKEAYLVDDLKVW